MDTHYDYTDSHWETPATYIIYMKKVVIPDKDANIARLKLAIDQKEDNNLLSLYIPAGCTDVMQTCDTVANKPFKDEIKAAYRDYLCVEYDLSKTKFPDEEAEEQFHPKFTMSGSKGKDNGLRFSSHEYFEDAGDEDLHC